MEAENIKQIENQIGRLFHYFYENNYERITELFSENAVLKLPDRKISPEGKTEIFKFWKKEIEGRKYPGDISQCLEGRIKSEKNVERGIATVYLPCDIFIEKRQKEAFYGEWNTYSFRSEADYQIQYFLTHMQAWFAMEGGQWKFTRLIWNEILELEPWPWKNRGMSFSGEALTGQNAPLGKHDLPGKNGLSQEEIGRHMDWLDETVDSLTVENYMGIRNLQGYFTHEGMDRNAEWFYESEDTQLILPSMIDHKVCGYKAVKEAIEQLRSRELKNGKNYMFLPMICAPVIVGNDMYARGMWIVLTIEVKAGDYGIEKPPYPVIFNVGRFCQEFVKIDGQWKFLKFRHEIAFSADVVLYDPEKGMRHRMREKTWDNTWLTGPKKTGVSCPEDVFKLEMTMPQWTGRIRSGNSMDFVDRYMVNSVEEISMLVAGSTLKRTCGYENIKARFGPKERDENKRRENPAFHTLATPVIEFSEDGNYASAAWTDFAIADFSGAFEFPLDPVCYYATANKYYHKFVRDKGEWKLYSFGWEPGIFLGGFRFEAKKCRGFYKGWENMHAEFPVLGESYDYV